MYTLSEKALSDDAACLYLYLPVVERFCRSIIRCRWAPLKLVRISDFVELVTYLHGVACSLSEPCSK